MCGQRLAANASAAPDTGMCGICTTGVASMGPVSLRTQRGRDAAAVWLITRPQTAIAPLLEGLAGVAELLDVHAYSDMDPADVPPVEPGASPFVGWRWVTPEQRRLATTALRDVVQQAQADRREREAVARRKQADAVRHQAAQFGWGS
jgi:hypothetical protein